MSLLLEYSKYNPVIRDRSYITEVLGIKVPLYESYEYYTPELQSRIIREHLLLEGFFDGLKRLKDDALLFGKSLKQIITKPDLIGSFVAALNKMVLNKMIRPIGSFLKMVKEKLTELGADKFPTFIKFADGLLTSLNKILEKVNGLDGWKKAVGAMSLALSMKYIWNEIGELIEEGQKKIGEVVPAFDIIKAAAEGAAEAAGDKLEKAKEAVKGLLSWLKEQIVEKAGEFIKEKLKGLATSVLGSAISGGVKKVWDTLTALYGGAKFVMDTLNPAFKRFTHKVTAESTLREYVRELLSEQASYGSADGQSRIVKVNNMKIRIDLEDLDYRATQHSRERQHRHKDSSGRGFKISGDSIQRAIDAAIGNIINDYANGELRNNERFLIAAKTGKGDPLNIVGALNMQKGPDDFAVITVMRKQNFMSDLPTYEVSL